MAQRVQSFISEADSETEEQEEEGGCCFVMDWTELVDHLIYSHDGDRFTVEDVLDHDAAKRLHHDMHHMSIFSTGRPHVHEESGA